MQQQPQPQQPHSSSMQLPASSDTGPSSRLLIEDAQQGTTSARAQRTIDRYAKFVAERGAPVAHMNYSPFTKSDHGKQQQTQTQQQQQSGSLWNNVSFLPADGFGTDMDEDVAASSSSSSRAASRAHSPGPSVVQEPSALDAAGRSEFHALAPPVPHVKPGGEAWTVDFDNWSKVGEGGGGTSNPGSKRSSFSSGRRGSATQVGGGSKAGSVASSRKSSLNAGDPKLFQRGAHREQASQRGFESSQSIWHAQHADADVDDAEASHRFGRVNEVLSHLSKDKSEGGYGHGSESKRGSLKLSQSQQQQPIQHNFLRAHQNEAKLAEKQREQQQVASFARSMSKQKRASMPPLQNQRGGLMMSAAAAAAEQAGSNNNSRRGSMSSNSGVNRSLAAASRNRSQSLPAESLFLAYSQCALPAVMTSSLASMPVPSQPAIPVAVARRYSVLSAAGGSHTNLTGFFQGGNEQREDSASDSASACSTPTSSRSAAADDEMVYVNPESVDGIDTSSVLDTTAVHDIASPGEDADTVAALCPQPARRGSLSLGRSAAGSLSSSESQSRHSSPASSPVDAGEFAASLSFNYPLSSPLASPAAGCSPVMTYPSVGLTPSVSPVEEEEGSAAGNTGASASTGGWGSVNNTSNGGGTARTSGARSHSFIHTKPSSSSSGSGANSNLRIHAPTRDQQPVSSTPDYTPMTSPTNLSNVVFRNVLMSRRMSDVVARDIGKKLRILKAHMADDASDAAAAQEEPAQIWLRLAACDPKGENEIKSTAKMIESWNEAE